MVSAAALVMLSVGCSSRDAATAQAGSAGMMAEAANRLLASLDPAQKEKALIDFRDEERFNWEEMPRPRRGIALAGLDEGQRTLAMALVRTGLSAAGYQEVERTRSRELILIETRGPQHPVFEHTGPTIYSVSVFGTPSAVDAWGWRFEGHHISLNFTIVKGELVSNTPMFLGAQPADIQAAGLTGSALQAAGTITGASAGRALADLEDRARALVQALDEPQRAVAIFDRPDPRIHNMASGTNNRKAHPLAEAGLPAREMGEQQKALLVRLVEAYLALMPEDVAAARSRALFGSNLDEIAFEWSGGTQRGEGHYYTVQGPTFLIDYAQNGPNHIHTLWRDFDDDFGESVLRED